MKQFLYLITILFLLLCASACSKQPPHYVIGVSQCSDDDWRTQLNNEIMREAQFYRNVTVKVRAANDDSQQQMRDIEELVSMGADLLIVSPNVVDDVSPAIEMAYNNGIPVILVDRRTRSEKCTAYVGADNYEIGRRAGEYIANRLQGDGSVVEISGLATSTPAIERHSGFADAIADKPGIKVVATADAGWNEPQAEEAIDSILAANDDIDLIFAHNDRMAAGAYHAAEKLGREKEMLFIGVDALPGHDRGVDMVASGKLDATFIYPTGGEKVMQVAMAILQGQPYEQRNMLSTALVNKANARIMQMQTAQIATLDEKIRTLNGRIDTYWSQYSMQRVVLVTCIIIMVLAMVLLFFAIKAYWTKKRLNDELSSQKHKLELQKAQLELQRDQLIELSKQLESATHAKLKFFTSISHDLRTPLTLIADPVEQLSHNKSLDDSGKHLINIIHKNLSILLRLINQLLDFRKYEEGKLVLHLCHFDISKELMSWAEAFRTLSYKKHIKYTINMAEARDGYEITADIEKVERITYNLLSNAFKFTPEGGCVAVSLSRDGDADNAVIRLQVSDSGIGITNEQAEHLFDDFYQVNDTSGSGIGLALVKAFADMHGGSVTADGGEGKGCTFVVELPVKQPGEPEHEQHAHGDKLDNLREGAILAASQESTNATNTAAPSDKHNTVLIIDDNEDIRDYMRSLLANEYNVVEAANGKEGLQMALKYVPDAIVCDVMMPVMDGMECCRRLKSELQTSHIPVILLTAYAMDEHRIEGYECGADSYLTKPFKGQMLAARLHNLLENRRRLQASFGSHIPSANATATPTQQISDIDKGFLDRLNEQIAMHLAESEYSVEEMGAQVGLSRVQLYRKTKALTGHSPNELLRMARLKMAASLLASTDKTVAEVGYAVGFASPSYFAKCYKEYYGENPTDFIKRKTEP